MKADATKQTGAKPPDEKEAPLGVRIRKEVVAWAWVVGIFLLINGTIGQARVIPSGSMEKTILVGDHLIMSRLGYDAGVPFTKWHVSLWKNPQRQQIVIFHPPYDPGSTDLIKRVIGLPGDTVEIRKNSVWINGERLVEDYTTGPTKAAPRAELVAPFTGVPFAVPPEHYFVMGDNRGDSYDSRYWGCVPRSDIIGTPVTIYMSVDEDGEAWNGSAVQRALAYLDAALHPSKVRWKRLFETF